MGSWEYMCVWAGDVKVSSMEFLKLAQGALRYAEDCVCVGEGGAYISVASFISLRC